MQAGYNEPYYERQRMAIRTKGGYMSVCLECVDTPRPRGMMWAIRETPTMTRPEFVDLRKQLVSEYERLTEYLELLYIRRQFNPDWDQHYIQAALNRSQVREQILNLDTPSRP